MSLGNLDPNGIGRYEETTPIGSKFSDYLNLGLAAVSTVVTGILSRLAALESRPVCVLGKSANQNLTTSAAPLTWDVEVSDTSGMHTGSSSQIVAPVAGLYMVTAQVYNTNTSGTGTISGRKNGATNIQGSWTRRDGTANAGLPLSTTFPVQLAAGDYVEIMVTHSTAANAIEGGSSLTGATVAMRRIA